MNLTTLIYFYGIVDKIITISFALSIISFLFGSLLIIESDYNSKSEETFQKSKKPLRFVGFFSLLIAVLTPSSSTIAQMAIIPKLVESDAVKKDLPELYDIAVDALKKTLKGENTAEKSKN